MKKQMTTKLLLMIALIASLLLSFTLTSYAQEVNAEAQIAESVLGIVVDFATVEGGTEINGKPAYRTEVTMLVGGESRTFCTEDLPAADLPETDYIDISTTPYGLTTNRLAYLHLQSDGKIEINTVSNENYINIDYLEYNDLEFAAAAAVSGNLVTTTVVESWANPVPKGWTVDSEGLPVYNEDPSDGWITFGESETVSICDETEFITVLGKLKDKSYNDTLFQEITVKNCSEGGNIKVSDFDSDTYYIFAYTVFEENETENPENYGSLQNVIVFPRFYLDPDAHYADYMAVDAAKAKVPADLAIYTDETAQAVTTAVSAVVYNLTEDQQEFVDAYAAAIEDAVAKLELKVLEPIVLTDDLVNYRLRCTTAVVDSNLVLNANPAGSSSMKVRLGNVPEGVVVAIAEANSYVSMSDNIITVNKPDFGKVEVPMTITSAEGAVTEFVLVGDFGTPVTYMLRSSFVHSGNSITFTSGSANCYIGFEGTLSVKSASRNMLGRYMVSGKYIRFYNPVYDNGEFVIEVTEDDGTVTEYNVTVAFAVRDYSPVVATKRCTYTVDGDTVTVTADAGVTNVYLQIGKYWGETLSIVGSDENGNLFDGNGNYSVKHIEARGWRAYKTDSAIEFDMVYDAVLAGGDAVTRHFVINF